MVWILRGTVTRDRLFVDRTLLALLIGVVSLANVQWIRADAAPMAQPADPYIYARNTLEFMHAVKLGQLADIPAALWDLSFMGRPPLYQIISIPFVALFGPSIDAMLGSNVLLNGVLLALVGVQAEQLGLFMLGTSLIIIGLSLLAWRLGVPDRLAFTSAGVVLLIWWLVPSNPLVEALLPDVEGGIELFFISGIMVVLGAVWMMSNNKTLPRRQLAPYLLHAVSGVLRATNE